MTNPAANSPTTQRSTMAIATSLETWSGIRLQLAGVYPAFAELRHRIQILNPALPFPKQRSTLVGGELEMILQSVEIFSAFLLFGAL